MSPRKEPEPLSRKTQDDDEDVSISRTTLRDQILAALKARGGPEASGFVDQLNQDNQDVLSQKVTLQVPFNVRDGFLEKSMTTWVDKMFDHFNNYVYEFNPAVRGTELEITFSRPEIVTEQVISNRYRDPDKVINMFVGRLATRAWTLLVRGQKEKIEAFIVPGDRVIGLTRTQTTYRPYLLLEALFSTGKVFWKQNGQFVKIERLEEITRELFTALIRFARGELTEDYVLASGNCDVPLMEPSVPESVQENRNANQMRSEFEEQFFKDAAAEAEARRKEEEATARRAQSQSGRFKVKDAVKEAAAAKIDKKEDPAEPSAKDQKESTRISREEPAPGKVSQRASQSNPKISPAAAAAGQLGPKSPTPTPSSVRPASEQVSAIPEAPPQAAPQGAAANATTAPQPKAGPAPPNATGSVPEPAKQAEPAKVQQPEPAQATASAQQQPIQPAPPETHQHMPPPHGPHREQQMDHHHHHPGSTEHHFPPVIEEVKTQTPASSNQAAPTDKTPRSDQAMPLETAETNVTLACDILLKSVDNELENVTRSGAEAFKNIDLDKVQKSMKQTIKLKAFREKVLTLLSDWSAANAED